MRLDDLLAAGKLGEFFLIVTCILENCMSIRKGERLQISKAFIGARGGTGYSNNTSIQGPSEPSFGDDSLQEALPDAERMLRQLLNTETSTIPESLFDAFDPVSQAIQTQQELLVEFHPDKNSSSHAKEVFQPLGCAFWMFFSCYHFVPAQDQ